MTTADMIRNAWGILCAAFALGAVCGAALIMWAVECAIRPLLDRMEDVMRALGERSRRTGGRN